MVDHWPSSKVGMPGCTMVVRNYVTPIAADHGSMCTAYP